MLPTLRLRSICASYLRVAYAISQQRLTRLMLELFGLAIGEGALDAAFQRAIPCRDAEVSAILARLRRARVVCSDKTGARINGRNARNRVVRNGEVVIRIIRHSRATGVVHELPDGRHPVFRVSDLYRARQGHAEAWQICLARRRHRLAAIIPPQPPPATGAPTRLQIGRLQIANARCPRRNVRARSARARSWPGRVTPPHGAGVRLAEQAVELAATGPGSAHDLLKRLARAPSGGGPAGHIWAFGIWASTP